MQATLGAVVGLTLVTLLVLPAKPQTKKRPPQPSTKTTDEPTIQNLNPQQHDVIENATPQAPKEQITPR